MSVTDAIHLALSGLKGSSIRTILTILGLAIGVGAILTVLSLGSAGEERVEAEIAKLGVNKIWISSMNKNSKLKLPDADSLTAHTQSPACAGAYSVSSIHMGGTAVYAQVAVFDENFIKVHAPKLLEGRLFRSFDFAHRNAVCLVDQTLAERFEHAVPGTYITLGNRRLRIIGIIKSMAMNAMSGWNGMVIVPLQTYMDTFNGEIAEITISVQPGQSTASVTAKAITLFPEKEGYRAVTLENEINAAREIVRIFVMVLASVAIICMLTGGIGVMNVLLISVRERRREIGLMKAIGGSEHQVCLLFLLEAISYAVLGSMLGICIGILLIQIIGRCIGLNAQLQLKTILPVLLGAVCIGLAAGVAPAIQAARMQPVNALSSD